MERTVNNNNNNNKLTLLNNQNIIVTRTTAFISSTQRGILHWIQLQQENYSFACQKCCLTNRSQLLQFSISRRIVTDVTALAQPRQPLWLSMQLCTSSFCHSEGRAQSNTWYDVFFSIGFAYKRILILRGWHTTAI